MVLWNGLEGAKLNKQLKFEEKLQTFHVRNISDFCFAWSKFSGSGKNSTPLKTKC